MATTLALDVGATKIAWGFVADEDPVQATNLGRIPTQPPGGSPQEQIQKAIAQAVEDSGITPARIGIGSPGAIAAPEGIVVHNGDTMKGWTGTDVRGLAREVIDVPCAVHNDVRIWAYGELTVGQAQEFREGRVLFLALGTGVGGAVSERGALLSGPTGTAGEFSELLCADFRGYADRAENIMSGNGLAAYYEEISADPSVGRIPWRDRCELRVPLEEVVQRMHAGDELARRIIEGNAYGLGRAVAGLASGFDLDAVVLGGGVSHIGEAVEKPFTQAIHEHALRPNKDIPTFVTSSPATAPILGAAAYARDYAF
ncbi:ROK family protein [Corynebacterium sp.]|uniref:ROK family protein n=1 Tax=Corynebacterium sp. TaxID=1720 RepID=UPI0026DB9DB1|nr:ROK family protein [Corynebacterium sp.]MDO5031112.1 ROK family protein [Corynebacterium sp.]